MARNVIKIKFLDEALTIAGDSKICMINGFLVYYFKLCDDISICKSRKIISIIIQLKHVSLLFSLSTTSVNNNDEEKHRPEEKMQTENTV